MCRHLMINVLEFTSIYVLFQLPYRVINHCYATQKNWKQLKKLNTAVEIKKAPLPTFSFQKWKW